MQEVTVDVYAKKTHCTYCNAMRSELDRWIGDTRDDTQVEVNDFFIEEHPEVFDHGDFLAAPIYRIERDGEEFWINGNNPDVLVDTLNGNESVWG